VTSYLAGVALAEKRLHVLHGVPVAKSQNEINQKAKEIFSSLKTPIRTPHTNRGKENPQPVCACRQTRRGKTHRDDSRCYIAALKCHHFHLPVHEAEHFTCCNAREIKIKPSVAES
jgi:hypothetical protein